MANTRLSRLHPYPAMVADELAISLSERFVASGTSLWDPFCGSGRFLAASAHLPGVRFGSDVNPLACLLSRAKLARVDADTLSEIAAESLLACARARSTATLKLETNRSVRWFSDRSLVQLSQIVRWINRLNLDEESKLVVAAALSATAREVSYARTTGWKLHRLSADDRKSRRTSAWSLFQRKLQYCARDVAANAAVKCTPDIRLGNSRYVTVPREFKLVMTSPPYGDSRTTVQYGAASELSLPFVAALNGLESYGVLGHEIDGACLGAGRKDEYDVQELRRYWAGAQTSGEARSVKRFLAHFEEVCLKVASGVGLGGRAVFVLARRSTGGFRLKLDAFTEDVLCANGFKTAAVETRPISNKRIPYRVNRFARASHSATRSHGLLPTMREEIVMVFHKPQ